MFNIFRRQFYSSKVLEGMSRKTFTKESIHRLISKLKPIEIEILKTELNNLEIVHDASTDAPVNVTLSDLRQISIANGVPFIGFGILDNGIMILAGEYIDYKLGLLFGISTMAAAGLGNMISDVVGLGAVGYVEALALKVGVKVPILTIAQRKLRSVRTAASMGRLLGISIGCLIGMLPLLFLPNSENKCQHMPDVVTDKSSVE